MQHDYKGFPGQHIARSVARQYPRQAEVIAHRGQDLLLPRFDATDGRVLTPNRAASAIRLPNDELVLRDLNTPWDVAKHAEARRPVSLGIVATDVQEAFVRELPPWCRHVLDMPIKFPGTGVRVPNALASFVPALQQILDIEAQPNPAYDAYYAYLSIHQARIEPGERMRENPYHVDGFQGPRWPHKHPVNHSYLLADALPTVFYPRSFPLDHLDLGLDDIYAEFARLIEGDPQTPTWRAADFDLVLMDAYCVHRGDVATVPVTRTWLRVSWETRIFDRLGNAHNPLFRYDWPMVARDTDTRIRPRPVA